MLQVGLTGGLGSGKTTVAAIFHSLGAHVIEADAVARKLMSPGHDVYRAIVSHFGSDVVRADSSLNRRILADRAFRQNRIAELNQIVHPPVIAAMQKWAEDIFAKDPNAVAIVESALIFEADLQGTAPGWRQRFDRIILVTAPTDMRLARYVNRMSRLPDAPSQQAILSDARRRIAAQIPDSEKIPLAHYVIVNNGSIDTTRDQVERICAELAHLSIQSAPGHTA
ncbi:MAG TPA: dephospho-CoA kinase [Acidobacteriaceae bacterium]|nr:dephospho-CoA kinase [Acidobacteriaceae bacterium]